jgi:hypothetical protein
VQLLCGRVVAGKGQGTLQVDNYWVEGTLLGMRRAAALDLRRRRARNLSPEALDKAGFANACFASQYNDLSHALCCMLPAFH